MREPGKHCLPKWYIENINDYIIYIDVIYWSCFGQQKHPVSYHLLILLQHKHKFN